jgi:hypothetical protein
MPTRASRITLSAASTSSPRTISGSGSSAAVGSDSCGHGKPWIVRRAGGYAWRVLSSLTLIYLGQQKLCVACFGFGRHVL